MAKRRPKKYENLKISWSPVNQAYFVLWPGRGRVEDQQVLRVARSLDEAEDYADEVSRRDNPRRPPKQWMRDCVAGASESAADPGAVCGALWYKKMSPASKRAALAREGRGENPFTIVRWYYVGDAGVTKVESFDTQAQAKRWMSEMAKANVKHPDEAQIYVVDTLPTMSIPKALKKTYSYGRDNPAWAKVFG